MVGSVANAALTPLATARSPTSHPNNPEQESECLQPLRFASDRPGDVTRMSLLLVDDRARRIVAKLRTEEQVRRVVEAMASDDVKVPEYLCLVECRTKHGALLGTDTSIKSRTLT